MPTPSKVKEKKLIDRRGGHVPTPSKVKEKKLIDEGGVHNYAHPLQS